ncbi:MAG: histidine kinase, partial [Gammaproteobacteria bacterium]
MHPFFDSTQKVLILLAGWLLLTVSVCSVRGIIAGTTLIDTLILFAPLYFLILLFIVPNYYVCQGLPLGETRPLNLLASHVLTLFVAIGMWYLLGIAYTGFLQNLFEETSWSTLFDMALYINIGIVIIQFEAFVLLHYLFFALDKSRRLEQDALQQKLLISQAELQTLRATVHPHFLFNSLNTLSNISLSSPEKAHRFCLLLAEFLRYSVAYSTKSESTLNDELEHIQNYLGIERERFGDRLATVFEVPEQLKTARVPPMLLFPLVENAIKHGIDSCIEGGELKLTVRENSGTLVVEVCNPVDELGRKQKGTGHGMKAVEHRLKNRYGEHGH